MLNIADLAIQAGKFRVEKLNVTINDGEYFILLGPTGAGKTVLLETIAGLRHAQQGQIRLGATDITYMPPEARNIGIVYQDQALFPHLSVKDNIIFGLSVRGKKPAETTAALLDISQRLGIENLLGRSPANLSGGERQKVALARALIVKPALLLLDEPLSAIDPETRENFQRELKQIQLELGIAFIHVTHDLEEAMVLGDRIAVLNQGEIAQTGTPGEIFRHPANAFVARFTMGRNVFPGKIKVTDNVSYRFETGEIGFLIEQRVKSAGYALVRPEDILITLEPPDDTRLNFFEGKITSITNKVESVCVSVSVPPEFYCLITRPELEQKRLKKDDTVFISLKPDAVHVF